MIFITLGISPQTIYAYEDIYSIKLLVKQMDALNAIQTKKMEINTFFSF